MSHELTRCIQTQILILSYTSLPTVSRPIYFSVDLKDVAYFVLCLQLLPETSGLSQYYCTNLLSMAAFKNVPASTPEPQSGLESSSTDNSPAEQEYTEQEYPVLNDKLLPANDHLYPPRTSSLQPPSTSHPNFRNCEETDHTVFNVVQSQLSRECYLNSICAATNKPQSCF
jgi:hypothetical protein